MTSPAYAACTAALERLLSPRVASRTLHAAMRAADLSPQTASAEQLEPILKDQAFKQLQVAMPPDRARDAVTEILASIKQAEAQARGDASAAGAPEAGEADAPGTGPAATTNAPSGAGSSVTGTTAPRPEAHEAESEPEAHPDLGRLRAALRPFNLYFQWPEVRRLRAQLGRLQEIHAEGEPVDEGVAEADATLALIEQKLEDQLVLQAQALASLDEAFEQVRSLGGVKVRRLESLLKRIHEAQASRQLADAELERGSNLVRDLRKMQASSIYQERSDEDGDQLREQLAALDQAAELEALDRLERQWVLLLEHRDDLAQQLREAREQVTGGLTLGDDLGRFEETFASARSERLREVEAELDATAARLDEAEDAWTPQLRSELDVLRTLLEDGLPPVADLVRFQDRAHLALQQAERGGRQA
ncbi:MAG: hypothetical protein WD336_09360, partial [Trueperaceae bacterium]